MNHKLRYNLIAVIVLIVLLGGGFQPFAHAGETETETKTKIQKIQQWLLLGPAAVPAIETDVLKGSSSILDFDHIAIAGQLPVQGQTVPWDNKTVLKWQVPGKLDFNVSQTSVLYLAVYLEPQRWLQTNLVLENTELEAAIYLDGQSVRSRKEKEKVIANLDLTNEKHLLIVKVVLDKDKKFTFDAALESKEPFENETVELSLKPHHRLKPGNIVNAISASRIHVSPDGKRAAVSLSQTEAKTGKRDGWLEILDTTTGGTVFSTQGLDSIGGFQWMGNSDTFSYTAADKEKTSIYQLHLPTQQRTLIIKDIEKFSTYWWAPDMSFMIYSVYKKEKGNDKYKHIKEIPDRAQFSGYKYAMYIYFPHGGAVHQVSDFEKDFSSALISPDGKYVLFSKSETDNENRPYRKDIFFLFDMETMSMEKLLESNWINAVYWSPDSKKLLMLAGPSAFDGLGKNLANDVIPNDYDTQAYIYDVKTRKAEAISKPFDPSINEASWSSSRADIYFRAEDKEDNGVFKYSIKKKRYQRLNTLIDAVSRIGFAAKKNLAVYWGSGAVVPHKLYRLDLATGKASLLKDYNQEYFKYARIGAFKEWNFKTEEGKTITGRIHYPLDFDKDKKYPCIVYYYGGTSPVSRDFGGRYPKNWYAAKGYVVYVLQPSGATGFGQDFSAVHVNDWGKIASTEIIAGVKKLIEEHPYIDPKRIGAMGASYGGFMTQYLATQTDIFAAYISHAGISALPSYWGIGDWGYTYSGVATAGAFPWNRRDIYVDHSPLFMADRISSPLLLLHGEIDNNVPPGESYQMFAALKLLGKDVELITFKGQRHFILEYEKRLQWMRTIIAWWDKHLKNQPEHWNKLYGK
jgi:dipeptidyl aminopeptidase/acylaminoacyl peptidase